MISTNGILGSDNDFAAVYKSVKAIRNMLLYELDLIDPNARLNSLLLVEGALVLIAVRGLVMYKRR